VSASFYPTKQSHRVNKEVVGALLAVSMAKADIVWYTTDGTLSFLWKRILEAIR
jgi:hypothetical protein